MKGIITLAILLSSILTRTLKNEKMYARTMLVVFLTFASFASVHVSLTHVTGPLTWTLPGLGVQATSLLGHSRGTYQNMKICHVHVNAQELATFWRTTSLLAKF